MPHHDAATPCATPYREPRRLQDLSTAEIAPLDALVDDAFPPMWYDIASSIYAFLLDSLPVLSRQDSAAMAILLTLRIAAEIGGGMRYIPSGYNWDKRSQAQAIVAAFKGNNHTALAQAWGVTDSRIRQILDEERQRRLGRNAASPTQHATRHVQQQQPQQRPRSMRALKKSRSRQQHEHKLQHGQNAQQEQREQQEQYEQFMARQRNLPF